MIIHTHYDLMVPTRVVFLESSIKNCYDDYFIPSIEEGIKKEDNNSYWTNVKGGMTSWKYFNEDKTFLKLLAESLSSLDLNLSNQELREAWGFKLNTGESTEQHNHMNHWSGIFYLNDTDTTVEFPEIRKSIKCVKNKFVFFTGILQHGTKPLVKGPKYGIAFNLSNLVKK
tara:strand:+ start:520 stop:1032 length:513 start_codon:yes stop_codon:yes gene_type:complete